MTSPLRYPAPKNDDFFEQFCLDLLRAHFKLPGLQRYGRRGQRQHGIDIIDLISPPPRFAAQCKADDPNLVFTEDRLRKLVADALKAPHKLKNYVILSTGKTSTQLQNAVAEVNAVHAASGEFIVEFLGWDLIERLLDDHPTVVQEHLTPITNAHLAGIDEKLERLLSLAAEPANRVSGQDELEEQISLAKDEIERRDFPLAKARLGKLHTDRWNDLTPYQRFLVLANLGNIEAAKGAVDEAARLYFESVIHAPEHIKGRETEAHAYLLRGDYEKAYELATALRQEHPESWRAGMLRLYTAPPAVGFRDLLAELCDDDFTHKEVLQALASRAHSQRLYQEGEQYARRALEASDQEWPVALLLLAECISHPVLLGSGSRPVDAFSPSDAARLKEADELFERCVTSAIVRGESQIVAQALVERAGIAERIGNEDQARIQVEDAYRHAPNEPVARAAYAALLQRRNELDRAIQLVDGIVAETKDLAYHKQLAELLVQRGRENDLNRAIDLQKELVKQSAALTPHFRYSLLCETLALMAGASRIAEGEDLIVSVPKDSLSPAAATAIRGRLHWHRGEEDAAKRLLEQAEGLLTEQSIDTEVEIVAVTLTTFGEYRRALALWKRIAKVGNSLAIRQTLACAQRLGESADILATCRMVRESGIDDRNALQLEADLLQDDDLEGAIAVVQDYLSRHRDDAEVRLRLTHIGLEHGRAEIIQDKSVPLPDPVTVTPYVARAVTYYLKCAGRGDEALRYGYEVLHRHFDDVDAHRAYMVLFVPLRPQIAISQPTIAGPGTAVEYAEEGVAGTTWHVIEETNLADLRLNEFSPSHPISKALTGKVVGDRVELTPARVSPRPAEIRQILNKYVYRMQRCSEELQIRFPDADELQVMHLPKAADGTPDLTGFLATIENQLQGKNQALAAYSTQTLPLHFVGVLLKATCFEAVFYLANDPASIIRCAPGDARERQASAKALEEAQEVVLDLSAIATLVLTERTDFVTKLDRPIILSQGCAEELDRLSGRLSDGSSRAGGRFAWHDNRVIMLEVTEEAALERERLLADAFAGIRAVATVEPCRELAEMSQEKKDPLIQIFGRHATQSILLAKKPGRILWTDDFVQSSIAIKEYGGRAAWSELIAAHLEGKGRIDRITAVDFVTRLLGFRYETVAITPAVLVNAARTANWDREKSPFFDALNPLANVPLDSSLFATIGAIATEMERDLDAESRIKLIAMICRTFVKRPDGLRLLRLIRLAFQNAPSRRGNEWIPVIDTIIGEIYSATGRDVF
jgi:tetratricopeptide (TPR) repeat protein